MESGQSDDPVDVEKFGIVRLRMDRSRLSVMGDEVTSEMEWNESLFRY